MNGTEQNESHEDATDKLNKQEPHDDKYCKSTTYPVQIVVPGAASSATQHSSDNLESRGTSILI